MLIGIRNRACQNYVQGILRTDLKAVRPRTKEAGRKRVKKLLRWKDMKLSRQSLATVIPDSQTPASLNVAREINEQENMQPPIRWSTSAEPMDNVPDQGHAQDVCFNEPHIHPETLEASNVFFPCAAAEHPQDSQSTSWPLIFEDNLFESYLTSEALDVTQAYSNDFESLKHPTNEPYDCQVRHSVPGDSAHEFVYGSGASFQPGMFNVDFGFDKDAFDDAMFDAPLINDSDQRFLSKDSTINIDNAMYEMPLGTESLSHHVSEGVIPCWNHEAYHNIEFGTSTEIALGPIRDGPGFGADHTTDVAKEGIHPGPLATENGFCMFNPAKPINVTSSHGDVPANSCGKALLPLPYAQDHIPNSPGTKDLSSDEVLRMERKPSNKILGKRAASATSSVISRASRDCQDFESLGTGVESRWQSGTSITFVTKQVSAVSLNSFSSSTRSDILTLFKHLSSSSRDTTGSSNFISILDPIGALGEGQASPFKQHIMKPLTSMPYLMGMEKPPAWLQSALRATTSTEFEQALDALKSKEPDLFGNTSLHVAAAEGASYGILRRLVETSDDLNAINFAGQSFMHLLDPSSLIDNHNFCEFLEFLRENSFNFATRDYQGTNMFQVILQHPLQPETLERVFRILEDYLPSLIACDYLGRCVLPRLTSIARNGIHGEAEYIQKLQAMLRDYFQIQPSRAPGCESDTRNPLLPHDPEAAIVRSIQEPSFESPGGLNGFHNLVKLATDRKTKINVIESYCSRLVEAGIDANHYDEAGLTPLLMLLHRRIYRTVTEGRPGETLRKLLTGLIEAGASVQNRGRHYETPLHVSVSAGDITATKFLIDHGANLNARRGDTRSVVQHGLDSANTMRSCKAYYLCTTACISLVMEHGGVENPDTLQEEGIDKARPRHRKLPKYRAAPIIQNPAISFASAAALSAMSAPDASAVSAR